MPLVVNIQPDDVIESPHLLAREASALARRQQDVRGSLEAVQERIRRTQSDPAFRRFFLEHLRAGRFAAYTLLAAVYGAVLAWEWSVSRPIYEVLTDTPPSVPFAFFVGLAFLASWLISEGFPSLASSSVTSLSNSPKGRLIREIWSTTRLDWRACAPVLGLVLALGVEAGVFVFSRYRVHLMTESGDLPVGFDAQVQLWLPVALFGVDIVLGIPAWLFVMGIYQWAKLHSLGRQLTRWNNLDHEIVEQAISSWDRYVATVDGANRNGKPAGRPLPPSPELRVLLWEYQQQPEEAPGDSSEAEASVDAPGPAAAPPADGRRVDDLVAALDEEIAQKNRGI